MTVRKTGLEDSALAVYKYIIGLVNNAEIPSSKFTIEKIERMYINEGNYDIYHVHATAEVELGIIQGIIDTSSVRLGMLNFINSEVKQIRLDVLRCPGGADVKKEMGA